MLLYPKVWRDPSDLIIREWYAKFAKTAGPTRIESKSINTKDIPIFRIGMIWLTIGDEYCTILECLGAKNFTIIIFLPNVRYYTEN
jgi:hypothetical protein